ncbi:MAG: glutathione S-transferase family protein [Alphaproteobacteria bacterium]|nr:MAG: glutathione S-transferase family protein [Alphaproteobacteria bacterium]
MIKLYGSRRSRATRCLWALEELGLDYEHVDINHIAGETQTDEFKAINPAGKVPTLVDGDLILFESMAINLYLAQTYGGGGLWPDDRTCQALALQWSLWAATEAEPPNVVMALERVFKPESARDAAKAQTAEDNLKPRLDLLNQKLGESGEFLTAAGFTIADLNVASVMGGARMSGMDLAQWPKVNVWLEAMLSRPAYQRAMGR